MFTELFEQNTHAADGTTWEITRKLYLLQASLEKKKKKKLKKSVLFFE